ncbi:MAG: phospholipid carrier-dependent glycosyltransferase [Cyanobacteria bacterium J06621_11]
MLLVWARFAYLEADFPIELGDPGMAYTDEGWWSRNAIAWVREGNWYIDDGYNPITFLPMLSIFQVMWFKLFGIGLASARSITVVCSLLVSALVYLIAREEIRPQLAWIAPFIVLSNYPTFAYSRLAILEMPMILLIVASLWLVSGLEKVSLDKFSLDKFRLERFAWAKLVGSGLLFAIAIFTKTTALFALPVIALLLLLRSGISTSSIRTHFKTAIVWLFVVGLSAGVFHILLSQYGDIQSQAHFSDFNVGQKVPSGVSSAWKGPFRVIERSFGLFPLMFLGLLGAIALFLKQKAHHSSFLIRIIILWSGATLSAFSLSDFAAPRYFLVLIVPIALVVPFTIQAAFTQRISQEERRTSSKSSPKSSLKAPLSFKNLTTASASLLLIFTVSTGYSLARIGNYLSTPQFTLRETAHTIERYIDQDSLPSNIVMGHFADTIALAAEQTKAINDKSGFRSLEYRIETFEPSYYLSIGAVEKEQQETLETYYQLDLLKTFDLYQNRDYGKPVFLYRLTR